MALRENMPGCLEGVLALPVETRPTGKNVKD